MGRSTKTYSGGGQAKFFRDLFRADGDVPEAAITRLVAQCEAKIAHVRVRAVPLAAQATGVKPASVPAPTAVTPTPTVSAAAAFDPFAFSVVAMLAKKGRLVLEAKLSEIKAVEQLRGIADAQHLGIDAGVTDAAALRSAIVTGAERRMAERKAAAS